MSLTKKIEESCIFIVLGTRNYIEALENRDGDILTQIEIATRLKKPFFIIIDSALTDKDKEFIRNYFSKNNVIKEMIIDFKENMEVEKIANEIKELCKKIIGSSEKSIITLYSNEDENDNDRR